MYKTTINLLKKYKIKNYSKNYSKYHTGYYKTSVLYNIKINLTKQRRNFRQII